MNVVTESNKERLWHRRYGHLNEQSLQLLARDGLVEHFDYNRGGGSTARLGGRELTLLCGFNQYTLLQSRDNSGLLGTSLYCSLKLGGRCPPNAQVGGAAAPPAPPVEPPLYNVANGVGFCESCVEGKHHRSRFEASTTHTKELLELVHTDVCGKMGAKSIGGAEYFISFTDDKSHYSWVYPMKTKDQAFDRFLEWKLLVENASGQKLKTLQSDNGGEFTSKKFKAYLKSEGV